MSKTRRIPARLKKRLEGNLQNLSVEEAGRLLLIYTHEADRKKHRGGYPPLMELLNAWRAKVAKSRGKDEEPATVAAYNGLVFLQHLIGETNQTLLILTAQLIMNSMQTSTQLERLLRLHTMNEISTTIRGTLENLPKPVDPEEYRRIMEWVVTKQLADLEGIAEYEAEEWSEEKQESLTYIDIPEEEIASEAERIGKHYPMERWEIVSDADFRSKWAEDNNLLKTLKGDEDRLEDWIQNGSSYYHFLEIPRAEFEAEYEAKRGEVFDNLLALLEAGTLEGGDGVFLSDVDGDEVLLRDGKLPALFALRVVWPQWVKAQDLRIRENYPDPIGPNGIRQVYDPFSGDELDRELDRPVLVKLVGQFLKDAKGRKWGGGLADLRQDRMKPEALLDYLIREGDPLLYMEIDKPDWGMVDFAAFAKVETGVDGRPLEVVKVATVESLAKAGYPDHDLQSMYESRYFPSFKAYALRYQLKRVGILLSGLQGYDGGLADHWGRKKDRTILSVFGEKVTPQFEKAVAYLQYCIDEYATLRITLDRISTRYFGGLPLLLKSEEERLQGTENLIEAAKGDLLAWLERLAAYPWNVDTSPLQLREPQVNEDDAKAYTQEIVTAAELRSRVSHRELVKVGLSFND